jgi:hypothetical protein
MQLKRALLIGIDRYDTFDDLEGCVNDVAALTPLLSAHPDGEINFDCRTTTSSDAELPTTERLSTQIAELLAPGTDVALLYFAGHAANVDNQLYLVTCDGTAAEPGVPVARIFDAIFDSKVSEVVLILDCCFAGQAGQVSHRLSEGALLRNGLSVLSSSRADQTSAETGGRGFFSMLFCQALQGAERKDNSSWVTLVDAYEYVQQRCGAWDQQPVLKVNMTGPCALRRLQPTPTPDVVPAPIPAVAPASAIQRSSFNKWLVALIALASLAVASVVIAKMAKPRGRGSQTPEVLIECTNNECSQEAITRCPEGSSATNRCNLRIVRGTCALGNIRADNNRLTRTQVRGAKGSRCKVSCMCDAQSPRP